MFGLSFGELLMVLLVAMVVLGPRELPRYLRKAGQFIGRLRRLAYEMRQKSGIDEVLRAEGIDLDIAEIRRIARGEIAGVVQSVRGGADGLSMGAKRAASSPYTEPTAVLPPASAVEVNREREYPRQGADAYGALPEGASVYRDGLAESPLASDPLYARGDEAAAGASEARS